MLQTDTCSRQACKLVAEARAAYKTHLRAAEMEKAFAIDGVPCHIPDRLIIQVIEPNGGIRGSTRMICIEDAERLAKNSCTSPIHWGP